MLVFKRNFNVGRVFGLACLAVTIGLAAQRECQAGLIVGTFEDQNPGTNAFKNDFRPTNSFQTGGFTLNNNYNATWNAWSGVAVSSKVDNTFGGLSYEHLYGAYAPTVNGVTGADGSATYGIVDSSSLGTAYINLAAGTQFESIDITNTTYVAQSVTLGDQFARAFKPGDSFKLQIVGFSGLNATGLQVDKVDFTLAEYTDKLHVVSDWTTIDLTKLAGAQSLGFILTSTDNGPWGMNTPATFAIDNIVGRSIVPEPSSVILAASGCLLLAAAPRLRRRRVA